MQWEGSSRSGPVCVSAAHYGTTTITHSPRGWSRAKPPPSQSGYTEPPVPSTIAAACCPSRREAGGLLGSEGRRGGLEWCERDGVGRRRRTCYSPGHRKR
ncbi:hypothetical protein XELAEV_18035696mg [Xenopus laevis]|uniref:Uncharacterized protein n=1 Tax=Xenopus laevis TaxID=8355 RepID=A0A974CG34_XENLA|nr:hypothetical protein XELAEV_18035696mg [Xenopus laevis]